MVSPPGIALDPPGVRDKGKGLDEDGEEGERRRQQGVLVEELDAGVGSGIPSMVWEINSSVIF